MSLSDSLPRRLKVRQRCTGMDLHGNQCRSRATVDTFAFLDAETHERDCAGWVRVKLCDKCCSKSHLKEVRAEK